MSGKEVASSYGKILAKLTIFSGEKILLMSDLPTKFIIKREHLLCKKEIS